MVTGFRLLLLPLVLAAPLLASPPAAEARSRSQLITGDGVDADRNAQPRVKRHAAHPAPADGAPRSTRQSRRAAARAASSEGAEAPAAR